MTGRPNLRIVDADSGVVFDHCPDCALKDDVIGGLERDVRGWAARYAQLKREKDEQARNHPLWEDAKRLFNVWRVKCAHPRARFDADRFWQLEPFLSKDGVDLCRKAIDGAAYDAYTTRRKNGSTKRHDGWELIFKDRGKFEEFCNRAPKGVQP